MDNVCVEIERISRELGMKVAVLIHELETQGGGERQCVALAQCLQSTGHDVTLYTSAYDPKCYEQICSGLRIQVTGRGWFPNFRRSAYLRRLLDMHRMAAVIDEPHDIWNPHHWPPHWASVWLKGKLGGNVVWMCNDVPDLKQKYDAARINRSVVSRLQSAIYRAMWLYDARQIKRVDRTLVLSEWTERELLKVYQTPVSVVRSGMDSSLRVPRDSEKIRQRFGIQHSDFVVLWLGIFMPHRRLEDAINALACLRKRGVSARLLLAGSSSVFPEYGERLRTLARQLEVEEQVIFAGPVHEAEIADFYAAADVFVFPNVDQTWGLVVIEAMAAGLPVVVSTGSGVHEVLEDEKTALKVPPREPLAIAEKLELLARNPAFRNSLADSGRQYVLSRFSWERYTQDMVEFFRQSQLAAMEQGGTIGSASPEFVGAPRSQGRTT
jgi:glycosyltransferase involved in cell wall biosynthesis